MGQVNPFSTGLFQPSLMGQFLRVFQLQQGDVAYFDFNQVSLNSYHSFDLDRTDGSNYYSINYFPQIVTKANSELNYTVTICDEYDFWQTYNFTHRYANHLFAYVQFGTSPNGKGSITASNALYTAKISDTGDIRALCYEDGCTLTATPATGYRFSGWYSDAAFTKLLSTVAVYNFKPASCFSSLYAKFEVDKSFVEILTNIYDVDFKCEKPHTTDYDRGSFTVPYGSRCTITVATDVPLFNGWYDTFSTANRKLVSAERTYSFTATDDMTLALGYINSIRLDAAGGANCYIAVPAGGFRFNAMTMGNGKATTGITPKMLSGNSAKVIWETGSTRGAVIKEAAYSPNNGLISFTMGGSQGNALIGLFDQNDVCVWSWHIWATDYKPLSSAQTYTGGRTFMDRNIGALSNDYYDPSFRGLYYEWGRKDPFIYPATASATYPATVVYHPNYGFDITEPMMGYGEMTLAWAIAHPWMYMIGIYLNDDRETDTKNWMTPQNPNLWGNPTGPYYVAEGGAKSIYDPCPVGWRVPDRKAWADAKLTISSKEPTYCYNVNAGSTSAAVFPSGGYTSTGNYFYQNSTTSYVWTNAVAQYDATVYYWKSYSTAMSITSSGINAMDRQTRDTALPVRCVKE